ncbi:MAG: hypothetical protein JXJ17_19405 [Anaerolineae bacterium]|nr:hypothetical protein [Anaerolineae bacterium]
MTVTHCHICDKNPNEARRFRDTGHDQGQECPICQRPTCRHHLVRVRWRWRTPNRETGSALICRECHRSYAHRNWDPINREWIS